LKSSPVISLKPRIPKTKTSRAVKKIRTNLIFSSLKFDLELIFGFFLEGAKTYGFYEILG
jgi:hypothetical protein